ncbi:MAG: hypothetical protein L0Z49_00880 [Actinobacteria bacterium]|nr:hypothetical protein [Actinomycetota bacterium]
MSQLDTKLRDAATQLQRVIDQSAQPRWSAPKQRHTSALVLAFIAAAAATITVPGGLGGDDGSQHPRIGDGVFTPGLHIAERCRGHLSGTLVWGLSWEERPGLIVCMLVDGGPEEDVAMLADALVAMSWEELVEGLAMFAG